MGSRLDGMSFLVLGVDCVFGVILEGVDGGLGAWNCGREEAEGD